jgi:hypothetical protein
VSVTGLVEAFGLTLKAEIEAGGTDVRKDWVRLGRKIDTERRRR